MNTTFFAFPVNLAALLLWFGCLYVYNREKGGSPIVRFLSSVRFGVGSLAAFALSGLIIAFFPETEFQRSILFFLLLLCLSANVFLALLRYRGRFRTRFRLNHAGILILTAGLACGAADRKELRAQMTEGETAETAYDHTGRLHALGYALRLDKADAAYYANGMPEAYRAEVSSEGRRAVITVNHPWRKSWKENVYIVGYGAANGRKWCVLEFVTQPWKYVTLTGLLLTMAGAILLLRGKGLERKEE